MHKIHLLDVTLRDGGYKTNFHFASQVIDHVLTVLDNSGIEYIEVGYRNGSFKTMPNIGITGLSSNEYLIYCKQLVKKAKLTVICHPHNITNQDIESMYRCGVQALRICITPQYFNQAKELIKKANKYNFDVFVNITRVSQYSRTALSQWISKISNDNIKAIYLADSNGSLSPQEVSGLFSYLTSKTETPLGFHAHDNLFLAQANALAAIDNGATYIDSSLYGLGKGAGNLRTEAIVSYFMAKDEGTYNLCDLLSAAEYIKEIFSDTDNLMPKKEIIMGIFDLSQDDAKNIDASVNMRDYYNLAESYANNLKKINYFNTRI